MTQIFQFLTGFDDRSLAEDDWVDRMLKAVATYNETFNMSLPPQKTVEAYLQWDAVIRSKERARSLWETLKQRS